MSEPQEQNDVRLSDAEWTQAVADMAAAGHEAGQAAGGWVADGNTGEDSLRVVLAMWDAGDPAAPCPPSPFSGEWADSPTLADVIGSETEVDPDSLTPEESDELATAYEDAFTQAWYDEAERTVRGLLGV